MSSREALMSRLTWGVSMARTIIGVNTGGRMTRKRTLHDLRKKAKRQQSSWWARLMDELLFIYLSGARGVNPNFLLPLGYAGRANNGLVSPDAQHALYGGVKKMT